MNYLCVCVCVCADSIWRPAEISWSIGRAPSEFGAHISARAAAASWFLLLLLPLAQGDIYPLRANWATILVVSERAQIIELAQTGSRRKSSPVGNDLCARASVRLSVVIISAR